MLEVANRVRSKKAMESKWFLYNIINKNPGLTIYDLSNKIKWSTGKVQYYVKKILKDGLIKNTTKIINGRTHIYYYPKEVKELINWDEMNNVKKPKKG